MVIRIQPTGLKNPQAIENVQSIVVYDEQGNPVYVAQQVTGDTIVQEKIGGPGFEKLLNSMGIGLNVSCKVVKA